jgi:hypothetical protein
VSTPLLLSDISGTTTADPKLPFAGDTIQSLTGVLESPSVIADLCDSPTGLTTLHLVGTASAH